MSRSKNLAIKYLMAAVLFFGVMTLSGLMSAFYYINPDFLFGLVHFNIAKILHIDTMIIWLLMGFMGAVYWFLPEEFGREPTGIWAAEILILGLRRRSAGSGGDIFVRAVGPSYRDDTVAVPTRP